MGKFDLFIGLGVLLTLLIVFVVTSEGHNTQIRAFKDQMFKSEEVYILYLNSEKKPLKHILTNYCESYVNMTNNQLEYNKLCQKQ